MRTRVWCRRCRAMRKAHDWTGMARQARDAYGSVAVPAFARTVYLQLNCGHGHSYVLTLDKLLAITPEDRPQRWRFLQRAIQAAKDGRQAK